MAILLENPGWVYRRKDAVAVLDETWVRHRRTIDMGIPVDLPSLIPVSRKAAARYAVPITLLGKVPPTLMRFDFHCGESKLSLPTRRQNGLAAYAALRWAAGRALKGVELPRELLEELFFVAVGPPEYAEAVSREMRTPGKKGPPELPRELAEMTSLEEGERDLARWWSEMRGESPPATDGWGTRRTVSDKALVDLHGRLTNDDTTQFLLRKFAGSSPVIACLSRHPTNRETVTLVYEENVFKEESESVGDAYVASSGWAPYVLNVATPYAGAASYHFEFIAPEGLEVLHADFVALKGEENESELYHLRDALTPVSDLAAGQRAGQAGGTGSPSQTAGATSPGAGGDGNGSVEPSDDPQAPDGTGGDLTEAPTAEDTAPTGGETLGATSVSEEVVADTEEPESNGTAASTGEPQPSGITTSTETPQPNGTTTSTETPPPNGTPAPSTTEAHGGVEKSTDKEKRTAEAHRAGWSYEDESGRPDFSFKPIRGRRIHLYQPDAAAIDSLTVNVSLRARRDAFVGPAFFAGLSVFFIMSVCCVLAQPLVGHANGAQSLLLVFPGVLIALLARGGEHGLVNRIVRRARWALVWCGLTAFAGAALLAFIHTGGGARAANWVRGYYGLLAIIAGFNTLRLFLARRLPSRVGDFGTRSREQIWVDRAASRIQDFAVYRSRMRQRGLFLRVDLPSWEAADALVATGGPDGGYAFLPQTRFGLFRKRPARVGLARRKRKDPMLLVEATPLDGFFTQTVDRARESAATIQFVDQFIRELDGDDCEWSLTIRWRPTLRRWLASGARRAVGGLRWRKWRPGWEGVPSREAQQVLHRDVEWMTAAARRQSLRLQHTYEISDDPPDDGLGT